MVRNGQAYHLVKRLPYHLPVVATASGICVHALNVPAHLDATSCRYSCHRGYGASRPKGWMCGSQCKESTCHCSATQYTTRCACKVHIFFSNNIQYRGVNVQCDIPRKASRMSLLFAPSTQAQTCQTAAVVRIGHVTLTTSISCVAAATIHMKMWRLFKTSQSIVRIHIFIHLFH